MKVKPLTRTNEEIGLGIVEASDGSGARQVPCVPSRFTNVRWVRDKATPAVTSWENNSISLWGEISTGRLCKESWSAG